MYFIPQKNRWFNFFAQIRPIYRYGGLALFIAAVFAGWGYGPYLLLDTAIANEQAAISRLESQLVAQSQAEREHADFVCQLPVLKNSCNINGRDCVGKSCYDQCSYLFEVARKAGLRVTQYHNEKEKKNEFKHSQHVNLGLSGSLSALQQFLQSLKKSCRLIQCSSVSAHRVETGQYTIVCTIQFISPVI